MHDGIKIICWIYLLPMKTLLKIFLIRVYFELIKNKIIHTYTECSIVLRRKCKTSLEMQFSAICYAFYET